MATSEPTLNAAPGVDAPLAQPAPRPQFWRRLIFVSPQITILSVVAAVLLVALIVLAGVVVAQMEASATVLTFNDTNRVFVQLQRETLRLIALVAQPIESFKAQDIEVQSDLVESRIGVMNFPDAQASLPPQIQQRAQQLQTQWAALKLEIEAWKADPASSTLRDTLRKDLTDFEFAANDTEVNYTRINTLAITDFAQLNQKQLLSFAVGAVVLVLFMFVVAISIYRVNQQRREVEAVRETNRLKDEFVAVVSHELRTPLNAIIGFLGIMKMKGELNERDRHMVERAQVNATRLLSLINDILDISKIEAGKFEFVVTAVPLRKLVARWQSQMDVLAKQKGLDFQVHIDDGLPESIYMDEEAVTKISTNLLSNAFKFTEQGAVSLAVKPGNPDEWLITVTDTGIGIPEDARSHIFESFRQVDGSTRRAYGGTGLGLSIVQRLCRAMGGDVQVESTLGKGSTFTVRFPLKASSQAPAMKAA